MYRAYILTVFLGLWWSVSSSPARTYLVDFGTSDSFRGISTPSPDLNGNHWNGIPIGVGPSPYRATMVDTTGVTNNITLGFSTPFWNRDKTSPCHRCQ